MSESATKEQLLKAVEQCLLKFDDVISILERTEPDAVALAPLQSTWNSYYLGPFAHLDGLLHRDVLEGGFRYRAFVPLSISSHNLHRLFEVLNLEIGDGILGDTRIPERVNDLFQHCASLRKLLQVNCGNHVAAAGTAQAY